jgi:polyribonucleotide nucleotidyltransferase
MMYISGAGALIQLLLLSTTIDGFLFLPKSMWHTSTIHSPSKEAPRLSFGWRYSASVSSEFSTVEEIESSETEDDTNSDDTYEVVLPVYECDVPIGEYRVITTYPEEGSSASSTKPIHTLTINMGRGEPPLILETGKVGRQAAGAVILRRGDTVLYSTCSRDEDPKEDIDFLPLSVEHQERFSSIGATSGSYSKRDGRPAEHEILTCRLIDRPIRPLIAKGWKHETQLLSWVLSFDGIKSSDSIAITNAATALYISDVPLQKPVAAVNVGYVNEQFILNPTLEQMEHSKLQMTVAGTMDGVLMIEGAAEFLPESVMIDAVSFGLECIKELCVAIRALGDAVGKEKKLDTIVPPPVGLQERVDELFTDRIDAMWNMKTTKKLSGEVMGELYDALPIELGDEFPNHMLDVKSAFKDLLCRRMFQKAKESGTRCDGRQLTEIRQLAMETSILPRVHGSALFTRGETQCIATATLGDSGMKQKIERVEGNEEKRFYLQYTFPPSCVGETGRVGMPGRREVGHGNLAER